MLGGALGGAGGAGRGRRGVGRGSSLVRVWPALPYVPRPSVTGWRGCWPTSEGTTRTLMRIESSGVLPGPSQDLQFSLPLPELEAGPTVK